MSLSEMVTAELPAAAGECLLCEAFKIRSIGAEKAPHVVCLFKIDVSSEDEPQQSECHKERVQHLGECKALASEWFKDLFHSFTNLRIPRNHSHSILVERWLCIHERNSIKKHARRRYTAVIKNPQYVCDIRKLKAAIHRAEEYSERFDESLYNKSRSLKDTIYLGMRPCLSSYLAWHAVDKFAERVERLEQWFYTKHVHRKDGQEDLGRLAAFLRGVPLSNDPLREAEDTKIKQDMLEQSFRNS